MTSPDDSELDAISAWFTDRSFGLTFEHDASFSWAGLTRLPSGRLVAPKYGRGETPIDAARRAKQRYECEEEPGDPVFWHALVDGAAAGPLSEPELTAWAQHGRLRPYDLVWSPGMPGWAPAQQTQPFAAIFAATSARPTRLGDDPALRWVLPVGRSGWAIAAGYLALFSVLLFPAPFALATGIVGIVVIKRNPSKHGMGRAVFGVVMGALGTGLLCTLFLLSTR
jgi:hypothetical protein